MFRVVEGYLSQWLQRSHPTTLEHSIGERLIDHITKQSMVFFEISRTIFNFKISHLLTPAKANLKINLMLYSHH